ncbi:hypothetical protein DPV78_008217 [Talaromyces pinophilus]|nr:hypothetical protein DPV78_008217 [Talaromyces pinophilus]
MRRMMVIVSLVLHEQKLHPYLGLPRRFLTISLSFAPKPRIMYQLNAIVDRIISASENKILTDETDAIQVLTDIC